MPPPIYVRLSHMSRDEDEVPDEEFDWSDDEPINPDEQEN